MNVVCLLKESRHPIIYLKDSWVQLAASIKHTRMWGRTAAIVCTVCARVNTFQSRRLQGRSVCMHEMTVYGRCELTDLLISVLDISVSDISWVSQRTYPMEKGRAAALLWLYWVSCSSIFIPPHKIKCKSVELQTYLNFLISATFNLYIYRLTQSDFVPWFHNKAWGVTPMS